MNNWQDVSRGVKFFFDDYVNMDNDLEVCGNLSDLDHLASVTTTSYLRQSSDEEKAQECTEHSYVCTSIDTLYNELRRFIEN